jgi:hypothetical protein
VHFDWIDQACRKLPYIPSMSYHGSKTVPSSDHAFSSECIGYSPLRRVCAVAHARLVDVPHCHHGWYKTLHSMSFVRGVTSASRAVVLVLLIFFISEMPKRRRFPCQHGSGH